MHRIHLIENKEKSLFFFLGILYGDALIGEEGLK